MIKIRISGDNFQEIREAVDYFKKLFPTMNFSTPKMSDYDKYQDEKFFSYGAPRVLNKKPRKVNFVSRLKNLKK